jgi:hypothetical protein
MAEPARHTTGGLSCPYVFAVKGGKDQDIQRNALAGRGIQVLDEPRVDDGLRCVDVCELRVGPDALVAPSCHKQGERRTPQAGHAPSPDPLLYLLSAPLLTSGGLRSPPLSRYHRDGLVPSLGRQLVQAQDQVNRVPELRDRAGHGIVDKLKHLFDF